MLVVCPSCHRQCRVPDSNRPEELPCPTCRAPIRLALDAAPPRLTWKPLAGPEQTFEMRGPTTIGAADSNAITLDDPSVAGFHACIKPAEGGWVLEDLGSGAATLVNSMAVRAKKLLNLDWIQVGRTQLRFYDSVRLPVSLSELFGSEDRLADKDCKSLDSKAAAPKSLKGIYQAAAHLAALTSEAALLEELCKTVGNLFESDRAAVFCLYGPIPDKPPLPLRLDASWMAHGVAVEESGEFRVSSTLLRRVLAADGPFLVKNVPDDPSVGAAGSVFASRTKSVLASVLGCRGELLGILYADRTENAQPFSTDEQELFGALAVVGATALSANRQSQRQEQDLLTRAQLARYLPKQLVDEVASRRLAWEPGGQFRPVTVILVSLRPAASFSQLAPQETVTALNDSLWLIVQEIFKEEGTLDRFLVLALTAVWGSPVKRPTDAVGAVRAALAIRKAIGTFNKARRSSGQPELGIGIAVATGAAITCGLGVPSRMEYTVLGQPVNWVTNAEPYLQVGQVLIDEQTFSRVQGKVPVRPASFVLPGESHALEKFYEAVPEQPAERTRLLPPRRISCLSGVARKSVPGIVTEAGDGEVTLTIKPGDLPGEGVEVVFHPGSPAAAGRIISRQSQRDHSNRDVEVVVVAFDPNAWTDLSSWLKGP